MGDSSWVSQISVQLGFTRANNGYLRVVALGYEPTYGVDRRTIQYAAYVAVLL